MNPERDPATQLAEATSLVLSRWAGSPTASRQAVAFALEDLARSVRDDPSAWAGVDSYDATPLVTAVGKMLDDPDAKRELSGPAIRLAHAANRALTGLGGRAAWVAQYLAARRVVALLEAQDRAWPGGLVDAVTCGDVPMAVSCLDCIDLLDESERQAGRDLGRAWAVRSASITTLLADDRAPVAGISPAYDDALRRYALDQLLGYFSAERWRGRSSASLRSDLKHLSEELRKQIVNLHALTANLQQSDNTASHGRAGPRRSSP